MSSKVIGGQSSQAQSIVWRKVSPSTPGVAGTTPTAGANLITGDIESLRARVAQLTAEAETREKRVRQQGYQEGEAAAAQKAAQQVQQALQRIAQSVEETLGQRLRMRQQMEEDLIHLAIAVARRILHRELTVDPEALLGIVKAAVQRMEVRELHRVRVSPADSKLLEQHLAVLNLPARVEIVSDPGLQRGSVVLETARGSLDSSIETQLEEIERGFADLVRRQP
jgi:flagellar assembly protein FliH